MSPITNGRDPDIQPASDVTKHRPLLVATVLNGKQNGYLLLDTGAYCTVISREAARTLGGFPIVPEVLLASGTGAATGPRISTPVHFAIADQNIISDEVVALDLSNLSHHYGEEILGVLGFPALSTYVLTIDYRNARVKIEPPKSISAQELPRGHDIKSPTALPFH